MSDGSSPEQAQPEVEPLAPDMPNDIAAAEAAIPAPAAPENDQPDLAELALPEHATPDPLLEVAATTDEASAALADKINAQLDEKPAEVAAVAEKPRLRDVIRETIDTLPELGTPEQAAEQRRILNATFDFAAELRPDLFPEAEAAPATPVSTEAAESQADQGIVLRGQSEPTTAAILPVAEATADAEATLLRDPIPPAQPTDAAPIAEN